MLPSLFNLLSSDGVVSNLAATDVSVSLSPTCNYQGKHVIKRVSPGKRDSLRANDFPRVPVASFAGRLAQTTAGTSPPGHPFAGASRNCAVGRAFTRMEMESRERKTRTAARN